MSDVADEVRTADAAGAGTIADTMPPKFAAFVARATAQPTFPEHTDTDTLHVGASDLPWAEAGDGSAIQLLHVDLNQGLWISNTRLPPGFRVVKHLHSGQVYAVTVQGRWFYAESPEAVCSPGSYLFEPAGSTHTLMTPDDQVGDTIVWFAVHGANINMDADGNVVSYLDARRVYDLYAGYCDALDLDRSKLIVVGG